MKKILLRLGAAAIVAALAATMLVAFNTKSHDVIIECPEGEVPECPSDCEYPVFFPHPNDRHWFFHCSNGMAYCKQCPADLIWNPNLETCDWSQ
jgi:hypothetical protein